MHRYEQVPIQYTDDNKKQIQLAKAVLGVCNSFTHGYIAGGAPRSWHFGKVANDVDIFFEYGIPEQAWERFQEMLTHAFGAEEFTTLGEPKKYKEGKVVRETTIQGTVFQFIIGMPSIHTWKYGMSCIYLDNPWTDELYASTDFVRGFKEGIFAGDTEDTYIQKFMQQYPEIKIVSEKEAELFIKLDNVLDAEERTAPNKKPRNVDPMEGWVAEPHPQAGHEARPQALRVAEREWQILMHQLNGAQGRRQVQPEREPEPEPAQPQRRRNPFEAFFGERR